MSRITRFGIGGLGGLLPVLASLLAVDIAAIIEHRDSISLGVFVGYIIRVSVLFFLGGIMAALNREVDSPLALVQLGIAAPALITSYINGATVPNAAPTKPQTSLIVSFAYAEEKNHDVAVVPAAFLTDVIRGFSTNLGSVLDEAKRNANNASDEKKEEHQTFRITDANTGFCFTVSPGSGNTGSDLAKSFPPPKYNVQPGACP